jgi:hypothetical protein
MLRTVRIATLSAWMAVAACKTTDKPAAPPPAPSGSAAVSAPAARPAAPSIPAARPVDPAPPAAAAPSAAAVAELQTRSVAMLQRMADMFAADGKDCDRLATDLRAFITDNKDLLSRLDAIDAQATPEQREAFMTRIATVQADIAVKMQGAMAACATNPAVTAAMKQFPAARD